MSQEAVLQLLLEGEALTPAQIAPLLEMSEAEVAAAFEALQRDGVLLGWRPVFNPRSVAGQSVRALIEVKLMPEREGGFTRAAQRIARFDEVETCYLMSGGYDLMVVLRGNTLLAVATFVAEKLAPLDQVQATATRFMLQAFKESGFLIQAEPEDTHRPLVSA